MNRSSTLRHRRSRGTWLVVAIATGLMIRRARAALLVTLLLAPVVARAEHFPVSVGARIPQPAMDATLCSGGGGLLASSPFEQGRVFPSTWPGDAV